MLAACAVADVVHSSPMQKTSDDDFETVLESSGLGAADDGDGQPWSLGRPPLQELRAQFLDRLDRKSGDIGVVSTPKSTRRVPLSPPGSPFGQSPGPDLDDVLIGRYRGMHLLAAGLCGGSVAKAVGSPPPEQATQPSPKHGGSAAEAAGSPPPGQRPRMAYLRRTPWWTLTM